MKRLDIFGIVMLFVSLAVAAVAITAVIVSSSGFEKEEKEPRLSSAEMGWHNEYGLSYDISKLGKRGFEFSTEKAVNLCLDIPEFEGSSASLIFRTYNMVVNVYIDEEPVSFINKDGNYLNMSSFQEYRFIDLSASDIGKTIRLEIFSTPFSFGCRIDDMYIGSASDFLVSEFPMAGLILAFSLSSFILGIVFVILGILSHSTLEHYRSLIYLGLFSVFISIWFISSSTFMRCFIRNYSFMDNSLWVMLSVALMFLLMYIYDSYKIPHVGLYHATVGISIIVPVVLSLLLFTGWVPVVYTVFAQHIFILYIIVVVFVEMINYLIHTSGNKGISKYLNIGVLCFMFSVFYDMCRFYQNTYGDFSASTRLGYIIVSITASCGIVSEVLVLLKLGIKAGRIGKIAYTDANTGIGNSAAFKMKMEELEKTKSNYSYIGIVQFDVNNLKIINDTKGHEAGDLLIKTAADIIDKSFGPIGDCYRTGGDEFVAITTYNHAPLVCDEAIFKFESLINQFDKNPSRPFDLRIAYGVAYYISDEDSYKSLKEVHKIADERMYNNKKELKAKFAKTPEEAIIR